MKGLGIPILNPTIFPAGQIIYGWVYCLIGSNAAKYDVSWKVAKPLETNLLYHWPNNFHIIKKHAPEGVSSLAWASGHLLQFATLIDLDGPFNNFIVPLQNGDVPVHYVRNYQRISFILLPQHFFFFGKPAAFRWTTSKSSAACRILSLEPSWRETDWGTQGGHRVQTNGSFNHQKWINMELRGELI